MKNRKFVYIVIVLVVALGIVGFETLANKNSAGLGSDVEKYYGKWLYKYTYLDGDKLYYTEEDGMEQYIVVNDDGTYIYSDYAGDVVNKGTWQPSEGGIFLKEDEEQLNLAEDGTLVTAVKDGDKMMMPDDFYNVLVRAK